MNFFRQYVAYLRDNPKKLWFKRKLYGWGWVPVTWQGWMVIVAFILIILWIGADLSVSPVPTDTEVTWFFAKLIIAIVVLLAICYKTGEKPRWQWGIPKEDER